MKQEDIDQMQAPAPRSFTDNELDRLNRGGALAMEFVQELLDERNRIESEKFSHMRAQASATTRYLECSEQRDGLNDRIDQLLEEKRQLEMRLRAILKFAEEG